MKVFFGVDGQKIEANYDRSKLTLGAIVYVTRENENVEFSSDPNATGRPYGVTWISPSEWYVRLSDGFQLGENQVTRIHNATSDFIDIGVVRRACNRIRADIPLQDLYLTSAGESTRFGQIMKVVQRLDLVEKLGEPSVGKLLFDHYEGLVDYLLLTCFDRLGQPAQWLPFPDWLNSPKHAAKAIALQSGDPIDHTKTLYMEWSRVYGVRNSFFKFLDTILPAKTLRNLLDSFDVHVLTNPPELKSRKFDDKEKRERLYHIRNRFTHGVEFIPGLHPDHFDDLTLKDATNVREQRVLKQNWETFQTRHWPDVLICSVKSGLSVLIAATSEGKDEIL